MRMKTKDDQQEVAEIIDDVLHVHQRITLTFPCRCASHLLMILFLEKGYLNSVLFSFFFFL